MPKRIVLVITLLIIFNFTAFAGCILPSDQADRAAVKMMSTEKQIAFWTEQWTLILTAPLNDKQRGIVNEWISLIPQALQTNTAAAGFFETELGLKSKELIARTKENFPGVEAYYIFDQPSPKILKKYTQIQPASMFIQPPAFSVGIPPNCTCTPVISACAWIWGCSQGKCTRVIACGPGEAFECTIFCDQPVNPVDP